MKKIPKTGISVLLTLCLVLELFVGLPFAAFADGALTRAEMAALAYAKFFPGVTGEDIYFDDLDGCTAEEVAAINALAAQGIVNGIGAGKYAPGDTVQRAMAAALMFRLVGNYNAAEQQAIFSDVQDETTWFYQPVNSLAAMGILDGSDADGGKFRPYDAVTAEEFERWLSRYSPEEAAATLTLRVYDPEGKLLTGGYSVLWESGGAVLGEGGSVSVSVSGLTCRVTVTLQSELARSYAAPASVEAVTDGKDKEIRIDLEPLGETVVFGTVRDTDGNPVSGAEVSFSGTDATVRTDENGAFSGAVRGEYAGVYISMEGYYAKSVEASDGRSGESGVDLGVIRLIALPKSQVRLSITLTEAAAPGETARTADFTDTAALRFAITNETEGRSLSDTEFTWQSPVIVFENGAKAGDRLTIQAMDGTERSAAAPVEVTLSETGSGEAAVSFVRNGTFRIDPIEGADASTVMIFDGDGVFLRSAPASAAYTGPALPDGHYRIVLLERTSLLQSVPTPEMLDGYGLRAGTDYLLLEADVSRGVISELGGVTVPALDAARLYYTVEDRTGTSVSSAKVPAGVYLTARVAYAFKPDYVGKASNVTVCVEIPDGMALVGAPTVDSAAPASYSANGGTLRVPVGSAEGVVRFFLIAERTGTYTLAPTLNFSFDGSSVSQPVGTARVEAVAAELYVPEYTGSENTAVSGTAAPGSAVTVYDNGKAVGTVKASALGTWTLRYTLVNAGPSAVHSIYAVIENAGIDPIVTETKTILYEADRIDVSRVVMYNVLNGVQNEIVFDYKNPGRSPAYNINEEEFTFAIEFDCDKGELDRLSNVMLNVYGEDGQCYVYETVFDEASGRFLAEAWDVVPVNVGVEYDCAPFGAGTAAPESGGGTPEARMGNAADEILGLVEVVGGEELENGVVLQIGIPLMSSETFSLIYREFQGDDFDAFLETLPGTPEECNFVEVEAGVYYHVTVTGEVYERVLIDMSAREAYAFMLPLGFSGETQEAQTLLNGRRYLTSPTSSVVPQGGPYVYRPGETEPTWHKMSDWGRSLRSLAENSSLPLFLSDLVAFTDWQQMDSLLRSEHRLHLEKANKLAAEAMMYMDMLDCEGNPKLSPEDARTIYDMLTKANQNEADRYNHWKDELDDFGRRILNAALLEAATAGAGKLASKIIKKLETADFLRDVFKTRTLSEARKEAERLNAAAKRMEQFDENWDTAEKIKDQIDRSVGGADAAGLDIPLISDLLEATDIDGSECYLGILKAYEECDDELNRIRQFMYESLRPAAECRPDPLPVDPEGRDKSPEPDKKVGRDPSGYVYEAVPSNRVEGVTATLWYKENADDTSVKWDASEFDQVNPLITDAAGFYCWYVPAGLWQVVYEKDGYVTASSDWLTVPPPQTDVNVAIISRSAPVVSGFSAYTDRVEVQFSQYMDIDSVKAAATLTADGIAAEAVVTPLDAEYDGTGTRQYASRFAVASASDAALSGLLRVSVSAAAQNYAGTALARAADSGDLTPEVRPTALESPASVSAAYGEETSFRAVLRPGLADRKLTVRSLTPNLVEVAESNAVVTTDAEGAARVVIKGLMPGSGRIELAEPDSGLTAIVTVAVTTGAVEGRPEPVAVTTREGAAVTDGMALPVGTELVLTAPTEGSVIRYTLNDVCPRKAGALVYDGPITITEDTVLRVVALKDGVFSDVVRLELSAPAFSDIAPEDYYYDAVLWAVANGITYGTGDGTTFSPNEYCTRGQIVTFLWRAKGKPSAPAGVSFTDVSTDAYYYDAVLWAVANGITYGTGDGSTFSPEEYCTRGQIMTFLHRAEGKPPAMTSASFTDIYAGDYYYDAVLWAVANGITYGTGDGSTFSPGDYCTRGQGMAFLYRDMG